MLVIAATVISAVIYHFRNAVAGPKRMSIASGIDWRTVVPLRGIWRCYHRLLFVGSLNGFSSFAQLFDNASHLNGIKAMADGGNYSILSFGSFTFGRFEKRHKSIW